MYGLPVGPQTYGGFASDAVNVPYADAMLVPIPDGVEPSRGRQPLGQHPGRLADVSLLRSRPRPGSPVLIAMGAGSIALYAIAIALALGAERVDVVGGRPRDRELAAELGANVLDEEFPDRVGFYPITVDASADPAGIACALRSTDADGICTSIGIYFEPTPLPLLDMFTPGDHLRHGPAARPRADAGGARAGPRGQVRPGPDDGRARSTGTMRAEALSDLRAKTVRDAARFEGARQRGLPTPPVLAEPAAAGRRAAI